jgi:hypothetical protein
VSETTPHSMQLSHSETAVKHAMNQQIEWTRELAVNLHRLIAVMRDAQQIAHIMCVHACVRACEREREREREREIARSCDNLSALTTPARRRIATFSHCTAQSQKETLTLLENLLMTRQGLKHVKALTKPFTIPLKCWTSVSILLLFYIQTLFSHV